MKRLKIIAVIFIFACFPLIANAADNAFLRINGDQFSLNGAPFVMKGFNYYPAHYGLADMTTWDWNEIDKELAFGESLGSNTVRAFIDYSYSVGNSNYKNPTMNSYQVTPQYFTAINHFLTLADKHHLKVIFGLFGYMPGAQFNREPDYNTARKYLQSLIPPYVNDTRIAAWEIMSEADLMPKKFGTNPVRIEAMYNAFATTTRSLDKNHLITIGFADIGNAVREQKLIDFISFHYYPDPALLTPCIIKLKHQLQHPMPIVEAEFGSPSSGRFNDSLSRHLVNLGGNLDIALNSQHLAGALFWQLMDLGASKTDQTRMQQKQNNLKFGVFDEAYQPKPSALLVKNFFTGQYNESNRITLQYAESTKTPLGFRTLALRMHAIQFLDANKSIINTVLLGTIDANVMQGQGWYPNDDEEQWLGNEAKISNIYINRPANAAYILLRSVSAAQNINELHVWFAGKLVGNVMVDKMPQDYIFHL